MIIVTGGAGFIGSNIIKGLNKIGFNNILVVDNMKNSTKYKNLVNLNISDYIDKGDFVNILTKNHLKNIDSIFHEGACSSTEETDGYYMMKNNYHFSKILLEYCINYNIPFLYASSAAIYGNCTKNFSEQNKHVQPLNIYAYSKFLFDKYVYNFLPNVRTQICGLRYFNVYGPNENHKGNMASIIFNLYSQMKENKNIQLFIGSENFKRDFIHIDDIVEINLWMWRNKITGIFNCGTGISTSFQEIANIVLSFYKLNKLKYIDIPKKLTQCYQTFTKANLSYIRSIGYNKKFKTINQGITEYLIWLDSNFNKN